MKPWASIDIETSGLDPHRNQVIEIGICGMHGTEWEASLDFDMDRATSKALEVNGWGQRPFAPVQPVKDVLDRLTDWFGDGTLIVAAPAHFDVGFLEALFREHNRQPPWGHRNVIDIKSFACGRLGLLTNLRNSEIARLLDVPDPDTAHTALGDAIYQADIFRALVGR
jgi:DNA polymerase III alpha subunit (gram-positive type)